MITIEPTAVNSNGTQYATLDHLGSPRVILLTVFCQFVSGFLSFVLVFESDAAGFGHFLSFRAIGRIIELRSLVADHNSLSGLGSGAHFFATRRIRLLRYIIG